MKNKKLTQLDTNQITKHSFDEENDSVRVSIVSGEVPDVTVNVNSDQITAAIVKGLEGLSVPKEESSCKGGLQLVEIPTIIKETSVQTIEVPVIVKEIEYKEIHIPMEVVKIVEIEKPIYITQFKELPTKETMYLRIIVIVQALLMIIGLIKK